MVVSEIEHVGGGDNPEIEVDSVDLGPEDIDTPSLTAGTPDLAEEIVEEGVADDLDSLRSGFSLENALNDLKAALEGFMSHLQESLGIAMGTLEGMPEVNEGNIDEATEAADMMIRNAEDLEVAATRNEYMSSVLDEMPELQYFTGSFEGLGGRDASLVLHEDFDPNQPYEIIYHFHGTHGQDPSVNDRFGRTMSSFESNTDAQTVIVYGLSSDERSHESERFEYDHEWPEDMGLYHREVLNVMNAQFGATRACSHVTLEGHSAGGIALKNVVEQGFQADRLVFLDSTYGSWAEEAYEGMERQGLDSEMQIFLATDNTERGASRVEGRRNVSVIRGNTSHAGTIDEYLGGIDNMTA